MRSKCHAQDQMMGLWGPAGREEVVIQREQGERPGMKQTGSHAA